MQEKQVVQGPAPAPDLESPTTSQAVTARATGSRLERFANLGFMWPAVLILLFFSIFPLVVSLYLSFTRLKFVSGGIDLNFVGLANYRKLLIGSEQKHFLGVLASPGLLGWLIFASVVVLAVLLLSGYVRDKNRSGIGIVLRVAFAVLVLAITWLVVSTLSADGRPGTLVVTLIYVYVGIFFQYVIGLGLALLTAQPLRGRRFFRVVFLLPMMITPVGVAYMFRMLTDTSKGPFAPTWQAIGLGDFSWVTTPWGARAAILIGDIWQWTPFMFIVLLAAIEGQAREPVEAAKVDGASRWAIFRYITLPGILPVSTALILIRMIEAYKIMDLPNVMTNGGPGTATESMTLQAFISWRTLDIGGSASIAYLLLILVTIVSIAFINLVRRRTTDVV